MLTSAETLAQTIIACFQQGNMVFVFGNGGSYDLARHFEEEMLCKFKHERSPLPMLALKAHTSISNDFGYNHVFSRQLWAYMRKGDLAIGISTSGASENVNAALAVARQAGFATLDLPRIGSSTAEIQENQLRLVHAISDLVEQAFLS
jgi:D-sedoheptulose 7-phosphate isomerase